MQAPGEGTRPTAAWLVINERVLSSLVAAKNRDSTDGGWAVRSFCRVWGWEGKGGPQMAEPFDTAPRGNGIGAAMSSSPWERVWNGDEDVATPFHAGGSIQRLPHGWGGVTECR
jgi:hypothetical protein